MARKQQAVLCSSCDAPLRADSPFCPNCGRPTMWATHEERVEFEVLQWRASRARQPDANSSGLMMLVRTDEGYAPAPARPTDYVWDQPLHPERVEPKGSNPHATKKPAAAEPVVNGNGNGHTNGNGHATETATREPEAAEPHEGISRLDNVQLAPPEPALAYPTPLPVAEPVIESQPEVEQRAGVVSPYQVKISKKAVALGIALAVGLPLGGNVIDLAKGAPSRRSQVAEASAPIRPLPVTATRFGFSRASADAERYAVVVGNPNRSYTARDIVVSISLFDQAGKLVGTALEKVAVIAPGAKVAIAGQTAVSGLVARMHSGTVTRSFEAGAAPRFSVRDVRVSRRGNTISVRSLVSGAAASPGAKVVAVYVDRTGRVLGGDFTFVDLPKAPRAVVAVVSSSGISGVARVDVFVVASR